MKAFGGRGGKVGDLRAFSAYGLTLNMVLSFKYLGRVLLAVDDDWPAVIQNLKKARAVWRQMPRILIREGARPRVYGFFFKAVVQSVLLFGAETWVFTPHTVRVLGVFQDQVACQMTGWLPRRSSDGIWEHTLEAAAREEAGFDLIETYIQKR